MNGYLQRLVDAGAAALAAAPPASLTPVVRSDSPVLADDQLLALGAPESAPSPQETDSAPTISDHPAPRVTTAGAPTERPPRAETDYATALASGMLVTAVSSASAVPPPSPEAPDVARVARRHAAGEDTTMPRSAPDRERRFVASQPAPAVGDLLPSERAPEPPPMRATGPTPPAIDAAHREAETLQPGARLPRRAPTPLSTDDALSSSEPPASAQDSARPRAVTVAPTPAAAASAAELTPRARPLPEPHAGEPQQRHATPAASAAATVSIGRVTVEVLPEPRAETAPAAPPPPVSAQSASCIGPLGDLRAARRLFALGRA